MKLLLALLLLFAPSVRAQQTVTQASQAEALRLYPQLAEPESPMNQRFLRAVDRAKRSQDPILQQSDWPLQIANRIFADSGGDAPAEPLLHERAGTLQKLIKLTVDQVSANPFTFENVLIEMTGIRRVEIQEIERGVYAAEIWGKDTNPLRAHVTSVNASKIETARTLYVSVDKPKRHGTSVIIHGTRVGYRSLSTVPTPSW